MYDGPCGAIATRGFWRGEYCELHAEAVNKNRDWLESNAKLVKKGDEMIFVLPGIFGRASVSCDGVRSAGG